MVEPASPAHVNDVPSPVNDVPATIEEVPATVMEVPVVFPLLLYQKYIECIYMLCFYF